MFSDLDNLIPIVQKDYNQICDSWDNCVATSINLKKKCVIDAINDEFIMNSISKYSSFLNDKAAELMLNFGGVEYSNSIVTSRVKAQNSILQKLDIYRRTHENGKIPLNKCINDLFGIRIIIDSIFRCDTVKRYIEDTFSSYKCIDSSKGEYRAIHIYFKSDNYHFPWELQVWSKQDEENNLNSHKTYKQKYTNWENENKGGVVIG
ncbi:MAG: RelA/SpoT domain-containing protein [Selenomonadaceae bacterium]|nr:RelA/SpoT domain-containing protein [Selenomonadaceae bacterium]